MVIKKIRSVCPALNILANHGYINNNGKNLNSIDIMDACYKVFKLNKIICLFIIILSKILCRLSLFDNFNLKDISKHNCIEHDASLFHYDNYFIGSKNNHKVNKKYVYDLIKLSKDKKNITKKELKIHKQNRINHSKKFNPEFTYGIGAKIFSQIEMYILLNYLGKNNSISIKNLKKNIIEEKI
jgi:hypothetical protein